MRIVDCAVICRLRDTQRLARDADAARVEQAGAGGAPEEEEEWDAELAAEIAALDRAEDRAAEMEEREKLARLVREEIAREMQGDC